MPEFKGEIDIYALIIDELLRDSTIALTQTLREEGWNVDFAIVPLKQDKQFKRALECGVKYTVRMEDQGTVTVKDFKTRHAQTLSIGGVGAFLLESSLKQS